MSSRQWTDDEDEWLLDNYQRFGNRELERMAAQRGSPRSVSALQGRAKALGIRKDPGAGYRREMPRKVWTDELREWFVSYVPGHTEREISDECERLFGHILTKAQIGNAKSAFGVKSGTHGGRFERGMTPHNKGKTWDELGIPEESRKRMRAAQFKRGQVSGIAAKRLRPLLDVRDTEYGPEIKVSPRNAKYPMQNWIPLGKFEWMRANGREWPEGCRCVHADHDPWNNDPENIVPVPKELYPRVIGTKSSSLPFHDRETLEAAVLSARISQRRQELARQRRIAEGRPWKQDLRATAKKEEQKDE